VTGRDLERMEQRARELAVFCDGLATGGFEAFARRGRVAADDVLRLAGELLAERSARVAIQEQRDEAVRVLANHADAAIFARRR